MTIQEIIQKLRNDVIFQPAITSGTTEEKIKYTNGWLDAVSMMEELTADLNDPAEQDKELKPVQRLNRYRKVMKTWSDDRCENTIILTYVKDVDRGVHCYVVYQKLKNHTRAILVRHYDRAKVLYNRGIMWGVHLGGEKIADLINPTKEDIKTAEDKYFEGC